MPTFHKVYVDDFFFIVDRNKVDHILCMLNRHTETIKFTMENETNKQINFLNMTLIKEGKHIITNWYRKPYASNRLLNYYSSHKRSTILAIQHIETMLELSDGKLFHDNKQKATDTLKANNFPGTLFSSITNQFYTLMKPPRHQMKIEKEGQHRYVSYAHTINNAKLKATTRSCQNLFETPNSISLKN